MSNAVPSPLSDPNPSPSAEPSTSGQPGRVSTSGGGGGATRNAIIKNIDMSDDLAQEAVDVASAALEKYNIEKDIAMHLKKEFDRRSVVRSGRHSGSGEHDVSTSCTDTYFLTGGPLVHVQVRRMLELCRREEVRPARHRVSLHRCLSARIPRVTC